MKTTIIRPNENGQTYPVMKRSVLTQSIIIFIAANKGIVLCPGRAKYDVGSVLIGLDEATFATENGLKVVLEQ